MVSASGCAWQSTVTEVAARSAATAAAKFPGPNSSVIPANYRSSCSTSSRSLVR